MLQWQMTDARDRMWGGVKHLASRRADFIESVYGEVRDRGPLAVGDLDEPGPRSSGMWNWSDGKKALEFLFRTGRLTATRRPRDFARLYDLPERHLPAAVLARPGLAEQEGRRELLALAARHLGVATANDLFDYHRLNRPKSRTALAELVEAGRLVPVAVQGWDKPAFMHPDAHLPRWIRARSLLTPFDSLVWFRERLERVFDFHYRIEIYTPAHKRVHGYYVLPFLLGDRLVARVDLKADRGASTGGARMADDRDPLGSWSDHVTGWLDAPVDVHVLQDEDVIVDPAAGLHAA